MGRRRANGRRSWAVVVSCSVLVCGVLSVGEVQAKDTFNKNCESFPTWGHKLPGDERFVGVFPQLVGMFGFLQFAAYCDRETGLVWQHTPATTDNSSWTDANYDCTLLNVGGQGGWHLPLIEQLATLVDTNNSYPALPTGHPFVNVEGVYWAATLTVLGSPELAWTVDFSEGHVKRARKRDGHRMWCVRGGQTFNDSFEDLE